MLYALLVPALLATAGCLRLTSLDIPSFVMQGESVWLNCSLDLEGDDLYSIKWYKDDVEFYRYLPRDHPADQKYDLPGVYLDSSLSRQGSVRLNTTDLKTEGVYRCEASAESPTFQTVEAEKRLHIYVLPQEEPIIEGTAQGDWVNVTCRSAPSKPPAVLRWFIDGQEAPRELERQSPSDEPGSSQLDLSFRATATQLGRGVSLRCAATVTLTYWSDGILDAPLVDGGSPRVVATKGHLIEANCSAPPGAHHLQWLLGERPVPEDYVIRYDAVGLLGLRMPQPEDEEEARLKCRATASRLLDARSREARLGGRPPPPAPPPPVSAERSGSFGTLADAYLHLLTALVVFCSNHL